jgi:putative MATE family efflux protein
MVGQLGETAINSVAIGAQVTGICGTLAGTATAGVGVLAAQLIGARDRPAYLRAAVCAAAVVLPLGLVAALAISLASPSLVALLVPGEGGVVITATTYLRLVMAAFPVAILGGLATTLLQASGDTRTPMLVSAGSVGLNTVLNWFLIFGHGPFPALGVAGAAIATMATQVLAALVLGGFFVQRNFVALRTLGRQALLPEKAMVRRIVAIGAPITLDGIAWQGASIVYAAILGRVGMTALAAFMISQKVRSLMFLPLVGLAQGGAITVGQDLGAGKMVRARATARRALRLGLLANVTMALVVAIFAEQLAGLFNVAEETHGWAVFTLRIIAVYQVFETTNTILPFVLRGGGDATRIFAITTTTFWGIGIPLAATFGIFLGYGLPGVLVGIGCEFATKSALLVRRLKSGLWARRLARGE